MHQYIFQTPPDGSSLVCKLQDVIFFRICELIGIHGVFEAKQELDVKICCIGQSTVVQKPQWSIINAPHRATNWSSARSSGTCTPEISMHDHQREQLKKEISVKGKERKRLIDWGNHFQPRTFIDLISDGLANRVFMKWLAQWKPLLFHVCFIYLFFLRLPPIRAQPKLIRSLLSLSVWPITRSSVLNATREGFTLSPAALSLLSVPCFVRISPRPSRCALWIRSMWSQDPQAGVSACWFCRLRENDSGARGGARTKAANRCADGRDERNAAPTNAGANRDGDAGPRRVVRERSAAVAAAGLLAREVWA